jgi:translation initiation factor 1
VTPLLPRAGVRDLAGVPGLGQNTAMASNRLVYSTEHGRTCPRCRAFLAKCKCKGAKQAPAGDGVVRVMHSTKGRKGKGVTIVTGVPLAGADLKAFVKKLKARCGAGGAIKEDSVEVQGDHRETLIPLLKKQGWVVKRSGG